MLGLRVSCSYRCLFCICHFVMLNFTLSTLFATFYLNISSIFIVLTTNHISVCFYHMHDMYIYIDSVKLYELSLTSRDTWCPKGLHLLLVSSVKVHSLVIGTSYTFDHLQTLQRSHDKRRYKQCKI